MADALKDAEKILGEEAKDLSDEERFAQNKVAFFADLAKNFEDAPTLEKVDEWKAQAGRVKVFMFGDDEVYFFRALRSAEYKGLVQSVMAAGKTLDTDAQNEMLKDSIVVSAVLWPKLEQSELAAQYAGTRDSLYTLIMQASNFLTPEEAAVMVQEL